MTRLLTGNPSGLSGVALETRALATMRISRLFQFLCPLTWSELPTARGGGWEALGQAELSEIWTTTGNRKNSLIPPWWDL